MWRRASLINVAGTVLGLLCLLAPAGQEKARKDVPMMVREDSAGDWVVDRFVGNSTSGSIFFQGPARQAGGVGRSTSLAVAPDGRVFMPVPLGGGIAEVSADGMLRLVVSGLEWRADGLDDFFARGGLLAWNPKENCLYFWGKSCIRKLVETADGSHSVEVVVGSPNRAGLDDGPVGKATLTSVGNLCVNSRGTVFFYDGKRYGECLRKLDNGVVTTITTKLRTGKHVDGPLEDACFNFINLGGLNSIGENDDVLYLADHWNYVVRRIDLKAGKVTTVAGMRRGRKGDANPLRKRFNKHSDGPALTHASFNSGCTSAVYDPVHKTLWCGGPDENRLRWLKDGWVKTVMGSKRGKWDLDGMGIPAERVAMSWTWVLAVDRRGRAYVMNGASKTGYWRLYNRKEVK